MVSRIVSAVEIEADPQDQDRILLTRVASMRDGPVSFLRANKPTWRLLVERHAVPLDPEAEDAVADSAAAIEIVRLDLAGSLPRTRREIVLASFAWALANAGASEADRRRIHHAGYRWAVDNGRWDAVALEGLEARFLAQEEALTRFVAAAQRGDHDAFGGAAAHRAIVDRWRGRATVPRLGNALDRHANRLGVFAEPAAILHYFLWRLTPP
jgi:hypothetical protein